MGHKGHWGEYTGNAKWSRDHARTKVTSKNYDDAVKDDAAHIDYLKRDVMYDDHHGHSDENMTADEKHISKLAGDMKYDKEHHGSPAKNIVGMANKAAGMASDAAEAMRVKNMTNQGSNAGDRLKSFLKDNALTGKSGVAADSGDSILSESLRGAGANMARLIKKNK